MQDPLGDVGGVLWTGGLLEQDRELVTAEARRGVADADAALQPLGHLEQHPVAGRVTEAVVDRLEIVEVEEDHRECGLLAPRAGQRVPDALVEQRAVGEIGDRIVERLVLELLLEGLALADVASVEHDAAHRLVLEQVGAEDLELPRRSVMVP